MSEVQTKREGVKNIHIHPIEEQFLFIILRKKYHFGTYSHIACFGRLGWIHLALDCDTSRSERRHLIEIEKKILQHRKKPLSDQERNMEGFFFKHMQGDSRTTLSGLHVIFVDFCFLLVWFFGVLPCSDSCSSPWFFFVLASVFFSERSFGSWKTNFKSWRTVFAADFSDLRYLQPPAGAFREGF